MQMPLLITFRHLGHSRPIEALIRHKTAKLERLYDNIIGCRVMVEADHRQHHKGNLYHVRIDLTVPNGELVVSREPPQKHAHEDAYVAVRDAFEAMRKQLQQYAARERGDVKLHVPPPGGRISELLPEQRQGIIEAVDGRLLRFAREAMANGDFDKLKVGDEVRFDVIESGEGVQAVGVRRMRRARPE